ncbi:hypothetical protein M885DRAFT_426528, partial [Pelagophyceae sp. CCMP2097]
LPPGWEKSTNASGDVFYVDHNTRTTHWELPAVAPRAPPTSNPMLALAASAAPPPP